MTQSKLKYPKTLPFFDDKENWNIPKDIKFGGELKPPLKPKEWIFYMLANSKNVTEKTIKAWIGSRSTIHRIKKSLLKKGYGTKFY